MLTFKSIGRMGRLANALYQICGTIGVANKSNQSFAFPIFRNYDAVERFGSKEDIDTYKQFVNQLPEIPEGVEFEDQGYSWGYHDMYYPVGNWNLGGHMQSEKYFKHCMDLIRHYMLMVDEPSDIDAVAIHIRRGDYDDAYHPLQTKYYYTAAMGHVPPIEVLLFSDDLNQACDIMDNVGVTYTPVEKDGIESFKIMKRCKHFITANSSYSMLAAILSPWQDKRIIAPSNWFGPSWGSDSVRYEMAKDIYPEGCIII